MHLDPDFSPTNQPVSDVGSLAGVQRFVRFPHGDLSVTSEVGAEYKRRSPQLSPAASSSAEPTSERAPSHLSTFVCGGEEARRRERAKRGIKPAPTRSTN